MDILSLLRCPSCKGGLEDHNSTLICKTCDNTYQIEEGIPCLVPPDLSWVKTSEEELYTKVVDMLLEWLETWDKSPFYQDCHNAVCADMTKLPADSLILELGCGPGVDGFVLQQKGYRVVESDISLGQVGAARKSQHEAGFAGISSYVQADSENIPFADASFDGVLMVASLHHLEHPLAALKEIHRVLKDDGIFVLGAELNSWQHKTIFPIGKVPLKLLYRLMKREGILDLISAGDQLTTGFSYKHLRDMLAEAGFRHVELKPAGYLAPAVFFISTELSNLLGRTIKLFPLERISLPIDKVLGRFGPLKKYPWHWNALAIK